MSDVKIALNGGSSMLVSGVGEAIVLSGPSDVSLDLVSSDVLSCSRIGEDLVVTLVNGETIVIEGFFAVGPEGEVSRLYLGGDGALDFVDLGDLGGSAYSVSTVAAPSSLVFEATDGAASVVSDGPGGLGLGDGLAAIVGGAVGVGALVGGASSAASVLVVTGSIVAGPVVAGHGLTVEVYDASGTKIGEGAVDETGSYRIEIATDYSGAILVRVQDGSTGADYFDEGRGTATDLTVDLRAAAVVDGAGTYTVNVNVLTELAVRDLGLAGGDAGTSVVDLSGAAAITVSAANAAIADAHGLTSDLTGSAVEATITAEGGANPDANLYGQILAAYSGLEVSLSQTTDEVLAGFGAGALTDAQKLDIVAAATLAGTNGAAVASALGVSDGAAIVAALAAVQAAADGGAESSTALDAASAALLGLGTLSEPALLLLNAVIDGSTGTAVDSVSELQALGDAVAGVLSGAAGTAGEPTLEDLAALGITGVTADNLSAVQAAIAATADDGTGVDTVAELQAVVTGAVDAVATIAAYNGTNTAPTEADYTAAGVTGVTATAVAAVNDAIATAASDASNSMEEIQALADAVNGVLAGAAGTADEPTLADLEALGITGVTADNLAAVQDAIAATADDGTGVDTLAEVQALADAVNGVLAGAAGTADEPTLDDLALLGVTGVTADNLAAVQAAIAATADDGTGVDTLGELQTVVSEAVAIVSDALTILSSYDGSNTAPVVQDYIDAGITGVDADNLAAMNGVLAGLSSGATDTIAELQTLADALNGVLAGAAGTADEPTLDDLADLGITGVTADNLSAVQAAIAATADDGTGVDTVAELQAVVTGAVDAVATIAAYNGTNTAPTEADYTAAGVTGVIATAVAAVNDAIAAAASDASNSMEEIQALADAVNGVLAGAAGTADEPTLADLELLGITGVTADNLTAVQAAIAATADDGTGVDTLAEVQAVVDAGLAAAAAALAIISAYNGTNTAPTAQDYTDAGVTGVSPETLAALNDVVAVLGADATDSAAELQVLSDAVAGVLAGAAGTADEPTLEDLVALGVTGVTAENLAAVQAAIAATADDGSAVDTVAELRNLVAGAVALAGPALALIAAYEGGEPAPTVQDYTDAGVTGVSAANLAAVNALVAALPADATDSTVELQTLADALNGVLAGAAGTADEPTLDDLADLGITGVTADNLSAVQAAIAATADDGTGVDTLAELQAVVTGAVDAVATIAAYNGTNTAPTEADYTAAGVTGVTATAVAAVNDAIAAAASDASNSMEEIQALADAVNGVLAGAAGTADEPTLADLELLGINGVTADNLAAVQAAIAATADDGTGVDTLAEVQALADAVNGVLAGAAGTADEPTLDDLALLGVTGVTADTLSLAQAAIAATANDGTGVDTLAELQAVIDAGLAAIHVISEYDGTNTAPTIQNFATLGVTGVSPTNAAAVKSMFASLSSEATDSVAEIQAVVDAVNGVLAGAAGTAGEPTLDDLAALGITDVTAETLGAVQLAIANTLDNGTGVDTLSELRLVVAGAVALAGPAIELIAAYDGSNTAPVLSTYTDAGVLGVTAGNLTAVNALIAPLESAATDAAPEVQALVDALNNVLAGAAGAADVPTLDDLALLGVTRVTAENLAAVQAAIAATANDGTDVDTLGELQELIDGVSGAMGTIAAYDGTNTVPTLADYQAAGVTDVTDPGNIGTVNAFVAELDSAATDTAAEVQAIVAAVDSVLAAASGSPDAPSLAELEALGITGITPENLPAVQAAIVASDDLGADVLGVAALQALAETVTVPLNAIASYDGTGDAPTFADYNALGFTGVDAGNIDQINAVIAAIGSDGKDTVAELSAVLTAIENVADAATNGTAGLPTLADLTALGITGVTADNLSAVQAAVVTTADLAAVDTIAELQSVADGAIAALATIAAYDGTNTAPDEAVYSAAGVSVDTAAVAALNNVIAEVSSVDANSMEEVQALADAISGVLAGAAGAAGEPSLADLEALGIVGAEPATIAGIQDAIANTNDDGTGVDTLAEIQALADAVNAVWEGAKGVEGMPTAADLTLLGVTGVDETTLSTVQAAIAAANDDGSDTNSLTELQALADAAILSATPALAIIAAYDGSNTVPTQANYVDAGVTGVTDPGNIGAINQIVADFAEEETNTTGELQLIVNAVNGVLAGAAGTADEPSLADLTLLGITGVTAANLADVQAMIANTADDGSEVGTVAALQAVVTDGIAALDLITAYDGTTTAPSEADYAAAGITGVVGAATLEDVNAFIADIDAAGTDTVAEVQAIATAVSAAVAAAGGTGAEVSLENLEALGITGVTAANLSAVQAAIAATDDNGDGVDTLAELQAVVDAVAPSVVSVAITSSAGDDDTYQEGDAIQFTVAMSEATTVDTTGGLPTITLIVGTTPQQATYVSGSGTEALVFEYIVQLGDLDGNGVSVDANSIALNGATLTDATGNNASINHDEVVASLSQQVDAPAPYTGIVVEGTEANQVFGRQIYGIGDFNGDGLDDYVVSELTNEHVYVVYGSGTGGGVSTIDEVIADSTRGFAIFNDDKAVWNGSSFDGKFNALSRQGNGLGDINGDGFSDFVLSSFQCPIEYSGAYIVFGGDDYVSAGFSQLIQDNSRVNKLTSPSAYASSSAGYATQAIGDINGDGLVDILFRDSFDETIGSRSGATYIILGQDGEFDFNSVLNSGDPSKVVAIFGEAAGDRFGQYSSGLGDINGDGYDDFVVAGYDNDTNGANTGTAYVVFGGETVGPIDLANLGSSGYRIFGGDTEYRYATQMAPLGDINGDGVNDFAIGSLYADVDGVSRAGRIDIFYGGQSLTDFAVSESTGVPSGLGFSIFGEPVVNGNFSKAMAAGDLNGDGIGDFALADVRDGSGLDGDIIRFVYGRSDFQTSSHADFLTNYQGFNVYAEHPDDNLVYEGLIGDVNGDGIADMGFRAPRYDSGSLIEPGRAYVVFGGNNISDINLSGLAVGDVSTMDFIGTDAADIWVGSVTSESGAGGRGDDVLVGNGGTDVLLGGAGNDTFIINADNVAQLSAGIVDNQRAKIDGGTGTDMVQLDGDGITLDFTTFGSDRIDEIEIIDISGSGANSLVMTYADVKDATDVGNTLRIDGGSDDVVTLVDFTLTGQTQVIDGVTYKEFAHLNATVLVEDAIGVATTLGGSVVAGPVTAPLSVMLYDEAGNVLGNAVTKDDGSFKVHKLKYTGNILVVVEDTNGTAGDYIDEFTGETIDLSVPLRAVVNYTGNKTDLSVTPMTELAVRLMGVTTTAAPTGTIVDGINTALASTFGVTDLLGHAEPVNGGNFDSATAAAQNYGMMLAGLSMADGLYGSMEIALGRIADGLIVETDVNGDVTSITMSSELQAIAALTDVGLTAFVAEADIADGPMAAAVAMEAAGVVFGTDGADALTGTAGTDLIAGGAGNDTITYTLGDDLTFGGDGIDTITLSGQSGVALDFSNVSSVETVDLTGAGDNTLNLSLEDLVASAPSGAELHVLGNTGDSVNLSAATGTWQDTGMQDGSYSAWSLAGSTVWMHDDLTVTTL